MFDRATVARRVGIAVRGLALAVLVLLKLAAPILLVHWAFETGETFGSKLLFAVVTALPAAAVLEYVVARDARFTVSDNTRLVAFLCVVGVAAVALASWATAWLALGYAAVGVLIGLFTHANGDL